jgi:hypothetical protein
VETEKLKNNLTVLVAPGRSHSIDRFLEALLRGNHVPSPLGERAG